MKKQSGFTIVELLIVIVIIGILAAITIVAYNGIQERSEFSRLQSNLASVNKAVKLYYADNGSYPVTGSGVWSGYYSATNDSFVPGLAPKYISTTPQVGGTTQHPSFIYRSDTGSEYKLIYIVAGTATLPASHMTNNPLIDPIRTTRAWGYWSSGGQGM
ncbi:MAG: prepilin-type N-terminal cleavage/methylation domain-containing protein [Candidatus Saccharimonadales bacterium]|jgi:prepilin-type N-terminal cleavage/methylation domain-containing protein